MPASFQPLTVVESARSHRGESSAVVRYNRTHRQSWADDPRTRKLLKGSVPPIGERVKGGVGFCDAWPPWRPLPERGRFPGDQARNQNRDRARFTAAVYADSDADWRGDETYLAWVQEFESPEVAARMRAICEPANEQNLDRIESLLAGELI